jgi:hypothetical protein
MLKEVYAFNYMCIARTYQKQEEGFYFIFYFVYYTAEPFLSLGKIVPLKAIMEKVRDAQVCS